MQLDHTSTRQLIMSDTNGGKKWLREASMRRLSGFVKNKNELIGNAAQLGVGVLHPESIEKSGLDGTEIFHLHQWVAGEYLCVFISVCAHVLC
jgi:hypothetical protein